MENQMYGYIRVSTREQRFRQDLCAKLFAVSG